MTTHTEVNTSATLARYFKVEKAVLADPLNKLLPKHLIEEHKLIVGEEGYVTALYAHRLALGEGDSAIREYLVNLSRKHPDVPDEPENVIVYNSAARNRAPARLKRARSGGRRWAKDVTEF